MATYLILNSLFIVLVIWVFKISPRQRFKNLVLVLVILMTMTAVFDSLIVGFGIVAYDDSKILGWYIGKAPIEDFMYTLLAVLLVPSLWNKLGGYNVRKD